jgi:hypothetical protein
MVSEMRRAVVVVLTAVALYSAWHSGGHMWRRLADDRAKYAAYTEYDRAHAVMMALPLDPGPFDFYRDRLVRGDRVYFDVAPGGYGEFFTLPEIVAAVGRYYLLPAVEVPRLKDATVVVSWNADPAKLGVHFVTQSQAGVQLIFVSRLKTP